MLRNRPTFRTVSAQASTSARLHSFENSDVEFSQFFGKTDLGHLLDPVQDEI